MRDSRAGLAGVWLLFGIVTIGFFATYANATQDDAYITFRYARNIVAGSGFVYNSGEPILGTTTPLYTLLLAAVAALSGLEITAASLAINIASLWLASIFLFHTLRPQSIGLAVSVTLIFLTNPFLRYCMGMESYFLLCLLLATVWAYASGRLRFAAFLGGWLALVRYEMGLLLMVLVLYDTISKRTLPRWIWPGLLPPAGWLTYALWTFGNPIPLSMLSKLAVPEIPFLIGFAFYWHRLLQENPFTLVLLILTLVGATRSVLHPRFALPAGIILLFSVLYAGVAGVFAGSFPWYFAPLIPGLSLLYAYGAPWIPLLPSASIRSAGIALPPRWANVIRGIGVGLMVAVQLLVWQADLQRYRSQPFETREQPYREISSWLNENALPGQSLATKEIGFLGYYTRMRILDYPALVTPGLFPWLGQGVSATLSKCLELYSPDYALTTVDEPLQIAVLENDPRYRLERVFNGRYLLYRRVSPP